MQVLIAIHHRVVAWAIPRDTRRGGSGGGFHTLTFIPPAIATRTWRWRPRPTSRSRWASRKKPRRVPPGSSGLHCSAHAVGQFPLADLASRGITVTNSRGIQSTPIAEHVMAESPRAGASSAADAETAGAARVVTERAHRPGIAVVDCREKTMGIIGLGTLGQAIATRAKAFGMRVIGIAPKPRP